MKLPRRHGLTKLHGVPILEGGLADELITDEARKRVAQAVMCEIFQAMFGGPCTHGFFRGWEYVPKHRRSAL